MRRPLRPAFVLTVASLSGACCPSSPPSYDDWCLSAIPRTCSYKGSCSPWECRNGRWVEQHTCNPPGVLVVTPPADAGRE